MLRAWIGPEMEGKRKGLNTLFIETQTITEAPTNRVAVIKYLIDARKPDALYLGAGRIDLVTPGPGFESLLDYCILKNIKVTIEYTSNPATFNPLKAENLYSKFEQLDIQFVQRQDVPELLPQSLMNRLTYKIDTNYSAFFTKFAISDIVDIAEVKDGQYPVDEIIYEEEEI